MGFGWKPRVEGLTWESLRPGDTLVAKSENVLIAYVILGKEEAQHKALSLSDGHVTGVRNDDGFIGPEMWEVFRAG